MASGMILALAMGQVAARADDELDELLARRQGSGGARRGSDSYAGLALAQASSSSAVVGGVFTREASYPMAT